jgi:hypothetical protein
MTAEVDSTELKESCGAIPIAKPRGKLSLAAIANGTQLTYAIPWRYPDEFHDS